jgi:hypothetical protein
MKTITLKDTNGKIIGDVQILDEVAQRLAEVVYRTRDPMQLHAQIFQDDSKAWSIAEFMLSL